MKIRRTLPLLLVAILLCTAFAACAARKSLSPEEFYDTVTAAGYALEDTSGMVEGLATGWNAATDNANVAYFTFTGAVYAQTNYAQLLASAPAGGTEKSRVDGGDYNRYLTVTDADLYFLWRNGSTLVVIMGSDIPAMESLIDGLGI